MGTGLVSSQQQVQVINLSKSHDNAWLQVFLALLTYYKKTAIMS